MRSKAHLCLEARNDVVGAAMDGTNDARSKHKKLCHDKVHQALHSDARTIHETKGVLDELWSMACADPQKRMRDPSSDSQNNEYENPEGFAAFDVPPSPSGVDLVAGFPPSEVEEVGTDEQ